MNFFRSICLSTLLALVSHAQADNQSAARQTTAHDTHSEYEVKTAFLFNFMQFITWQDGRLKKDDPIRIGVVGKFHNCSEIEELSQKKLGNHKIEIVKLYHGGAQPQQCHVIFVPHGNEKFMPDIIEKTAGHSVLIVADSEIALQKGAVISFYTVGTRIRFKVNLAEAKRHKIKISSNLLRLATIVKEHSEQDISK